MMRGIFFDLYGTLLVYGDMKKAWADWLHQFYFSLNNLGLTLSEEEFAKECDRLFWKAEPALAGQNFTVFEKRIKTFCNSLEIEISDESVAHVADLIAAKWQESISLDPAAIPVLKKLRSAGMILGLVSNFDHPRHVRKHLSEYGLYNLFETIIISGEAGVKKPDPDIFRPALSATGLLPDEVVYVGDSEVDVEAAVAAGIMPILISRQDSRGDHSDICQARGSYEIISDLKEILSLFQAVFQQRSTE